jgi:hypothetical protein
MVEITLGEMAHAELSALLREHVLKRRAFVSGALGIPTLTACVLVIPMPGGAALRLRAEVVFARDEEPGAGVGLQLAPLSAESLAAIDAFLLDPGLRSAPAPVAIDDLPLPPPPEPEPEPVSESEPEPAHELDDERHATPEHQAMHVRMRSLTGPEQRRYALTGNLAERIMLERLYGPNVWEPLLASGRLSPPEVATIARKGTVPRPLLETIASNAAWLATGEVQRALLSNPRSSPLVVSKVLRFLPKHELARVPTQTAYPMTVRQAAKEILKGQK